MLFPLTPKYKFSWYYLFYQLKIKNKSSCKKKKKKKTQYLIKNNQTKLVETKQAIRWVFFFSSRSSDWNCWLLLRLETTEYRPMTRILLHGLVEVRTCSALFHNSLLSFSFFLIFIFSIFPFLFTHFELTFNSFMH